MIVTVDDLKKIMSVCEKGEGAFNAIFPDGMELTPENVLRSFSIGEDIEYPIYHLYQRSRGLGLIDEGITGAFFEFHDFLVMSRNLTGHNLYYADPRRGFMEDEKAKATALAAIEKAFPYLEKLAKAGLS